jgi:hypothetical protein
MQMLQLRSDLGERQFSGRNFVARGTAEFLESLGFLSLL